jgi:hypothetical protein
VDIYCRKCGEPWDSYGITYDVGRGDMTYQEVKAFRAGKGCPNCEFGTICPRCHGVGIEKNECHTCFGSGKVLVRRAPQSAETRWRDWFCGYANSPTFPIRVLGQGARLLVGRKVRQFESADGPTEEAWAFCPDCDGEGELCQDCGGDGKFHRQLDDKEEMGAIESLLEASDEEPIGLLQEMGISVFKW